MGVEKIICALNSFVIHFHLAKIKMSAIPLLNHYKYLKCTEFVWLGKGLHFVEFDFLLPFLKQ